MLEDWFYTLPNGVKIVVPRGFIFDGASIPRCLWWFLSPIGLLLIPGLVHDYAYRYDKLLDVIGEGVYIDYHANSGHRYWDKLFRDVAIQINGPFLAFYLAWITLVLFGGFAWRSNRKKEKEIMIKSTMEIIEDISLFSDNVIRFIDSYYKQMEEKSYNGRKLVNEEDKENVAYNGNYKSFANAYFMEHEASEISIKSLIVVTELEKHLEYRNHDNNLIRREGFKKSVDDLLPK